MATLVGPMQVRVTGAQYGKWGREKYGLKPQKVDALEFYPDRLQELWRNIQEEQVGCCHFHHGRCCVCVPHTTLLTRPYHCLSHSAAACVLWRNCGHCSRENDQPSLLVSRGHCTFHLLPPSVASIALHISPLGQLPAGQTCHTEAAA